MMNSLDARIFLLLQAARLVGNYLYAWGGESKQEGGYDCSGFACDVLMSTAKAWPSIYHGGRTTAAGLYTFYEMQRLPDISDVDSLKPGCLVFYRRPGKRIHHVSIHAMNVPNIKLSGRLAPVGAVAFEAGGAGSSATTPRDALINSAGVRLTATDWQASGVEWVAKDPFILLD